MEFLALIVGLVAAATVLPALVLLCGIKRREAPVGASMANRRGAAPGGTVQIDPILQPEWGAKKAAREAQEKKQLAIIMSSKQARLHKAAGGGDEQMHIVMRQPSTMADKFALPSHLTKQLGQSTRRGPRVPGGSLTRGGASFQGQDVSVEGFPPQVPVRKVVSPPCARPDLGATGSLSASITRSAVNDISINVRTSAGGDIPSDLYPRAFNSSTSTGSRRAMAMSSSAGPDYSSAVVVPIGDMYPQDGTRDLTGSGAADPRVTSRPFARGSGSGTGIAWSGLNDINPGCGDRSADSSRRGQQPGAATPTYGMAAAPPGALDGTRVSYPHPRVAALSPMLSGTSARATSSDDSNRNALLIGAFQQQLQQQQLLRGQEGEEAQQQQQQQRRSSDFVERLTHGVDWSEVPVGVEESDRRARYALGSVGGNREGESVSTRPQGSTSMRSNSGGGAGDGTAVDGADMSRTRGGGGDGARSAASRTLSSRELHGRAPHLPSPLGSRASMLEGGSGGGLSGLSKRWTANGGLTPPAPAATAADLEAQLPGSAECVIVGPDPIQGYPAAMTARSQRSLIVLREGGGSGGGGGGGGGSSLDTSSSHRVPGGRSVGGGERATAAAAAAAASVSAATAARGGGSGGGDTWPDSKNGVRSNLTWSGMAEVPLVDVEAGPGAVTSAGEGPLGSAPQGSRAARAQALLARNRINMSRLAAATVVRADPGMEPSNTEP